jgi:hypothetical protein
VSPQPALGPFDGTHQEWRGLSQRIYDLALPVSSFDFSNPVLERHRNPGGSGGQITVRQCIGDPRLFAFVGSELRGEPAEPDLEPRLGVVGDEAGQPLGSKSSDMAGAVELMQASPLKPRRVAYVVQVRCGDQVATILLVEDRAHLASALADSSDVLPSIAERGEQAFSFGSGPLFKHRGWTIPRARVPDLSDRCCELRLQQRLSI